MAGGRVAARIAAKRSEEGPAIIPEEGDGAYLAPLTRVALSPSLALLAGGSGARGISRLDPRGRWRGVWDRKGSPFIGGLGARTRSLSLAAPLHFL